MAQRRITAAALEQKQRMDRLAEQVVAWHNSHPLAKRITIYDVHTIGVVALPFLRSERAHAAGLIEPVLIDEISTQSVAAAWDEESTVAAHPNAAYLDALADQEEPPAGPRRAWPERLAALLRHGDSEFSPAFSERIVDGLTAARIARFAGQHGHTTRPGAASWPLREVPGDEGLIIGGSGTSTEAAKPVRLYLKSAAIDAGRSRSRVLVGRAGTGLPPIIGRRCLSPSRLGLAGISVLALLGIAASAWRAVADGAAALERPAAAVAASAPFSGAASAASFTVSSATSPMPSPASAPISTSAVIAAAALPASEAASPAAPTASAPEIATAVQPAPSAAMATGAAAASASAAASAPVTAAASAPAPTIKPTLKEALQNGRHVVALVGPASVSKADAEALLTRMRAQAAPMQAEPAALQAQVFQTPEGWRAAVWPFASREEAQLINAMLVARGLKTKAVDF
jgi:hypothetical protein